MRRMRKTIVAVILIWSILASNAGFGFNGMIFADAEEVTTAANGTQPIDPWDYQKLLGKGMDVDWCKTPKGMQYYSETACKDFRAAGISHVRI